MLWGNDALAGTFATGFDIAAGVGNYWAECSSNDPDCSKTNDTYIRRDTSIVRSGFSSVQVLGQSGSANTISGSRTAATEQSMRFSLYIESSPASPRPLGGFTMGSDNSCYLRLDARADPNDRPSLTLFLKTDAVSGPFGDVGMVTVSLSRAEWHQVELYDRHVNEAAGQEEIDCQVYVNGTQRSVSGTRTSLNTTLANIDGWFLGANDTDSGEFTVYFDDLVVDDLKRCSEAATPSKLCAVDGDCSGTCAVDNTELIGSGSVLLLTPNANSASGHDDWDTNGCSGDRQACIDDWDVGLAMDGSTTYLDRGGTNTSNCTVGGSASCQLNDLTTLGNCNVDTEIPCIKDSDCPATETCDLAPTPATWDSTFTVRSIRYLPYLKQASGGDADRTITVFIAENDAAPPPGAWYDESVPPSHTYQRAAADIVWDVHQRYEIYQRTSFAVWGLAQIQEMIAGVYQSARSGSNSKLHYTAGGAYVEVKSPDPPAFSNLYDWNGDDEVVLACGGHSTTVGSESDRCTHAPARFCTFQKHCANVAGTDWTCNTDADCGGGVGSCTDSCPTVCSAATGCTSDTDCPGTLSCDVENSRCECDGDGDCNGTLTCNLDTGQCVCDDDTDCSGNCDVVAGLCECASVGSTCESNSGTCVDDTCPPTTSYPANLVAAMPQLDAAFNCGAGLTTLFSRNLDFEFIVHGKHKTTTYCSDDPNTEGCGSPSTCPVSRSCLAYCAKLLKGNRRCFQSREICSSEADCDRCTGGSNDTVRCYENSDCTGGGTCTDTADWCTVLAPDVLTAHFGSNDWIHENHPECGRFDHPYYLSSMMTCAGGTEAGSVCFVDSDCLGGGTCSAFVSACPLRAASPSGWECQDTACTTSTDCNSISHHSVCGSTCEDDITVSCSRTPGALLPLEEDVCPHYDLGVCRKGVCRGGSPDSEDPCSRTADCSGGETCSMTGADNKRRCTCPVDSVSCTADGDCANPTLMQGSEHFGGAVRRYMRRYFQGVCDLMCTGGSEPGTTCAVDSDCAGGGTCSQRCQAAGPTSCGECSGDGSIICRANNRGRECFTGLCSATNRACGLDADCPATETCGACSFTLGSCTTDADCKYCVGGRSDGAVCTDVNDCLGDDPAAASGTKDLTIDFEIDDMCSCVGGTSVGLACTATSDCLGGGTCEGDSGGCPDGADATAYRGDDLDDPCFWQSDSIPERAQVCVGKKDATGNGRLECYWYPSLDFAGYGTGFTANGDANNCAVDQAANEIVTTDRESNNGRILVHSMPITTLTTAPTRTLTDTEYNNKIQGVCVGVVSGTTRYFVTDQTDDMVHVVNATTGTTVDSWSYKGSCSVTHTTDCTGDGDCPATETCDLILTDAEGIACDDDYQRVYVCDDDLTTEGCVAYSYAGAPVKICDSSPWAECTDDSDCSGSCVIAEFGCASANGCPLNDDVLGLDAEGVEIYECGTKHGYIVVSDQQAGGAQSEFEVFQRQPPYDHLCTFTLKNGAELTNDTDGIDIAQTTAFGGGGMFMACDDCQAGSQEPDHIDIIEWEDIAAACGLDSCPGGEAYTTLDIGSDSRCGESCRLGTGHCSTGNPPNADLTNTFTDWWTGYGFNEAREFYQDIRDKARRGPAGRAIKLSFNHFAMRLCERFNRPTTGFGPYREMFTVGGRWGSCPIETLRQWDFELGDLALDTLRASDYADRRRELGPRAFYNADAQCVYLGSSTPDFQAGDCLDSTIRRDDMHPSGRGASAMSDALLAYLSQLDVVCMEAMYPTTDVTTDLTCTGAACSTSHAAALDDISATSGLVNSGDYVSNTGTDGVYDRVLVELSDANLSGEAIRHVRVVASGTREADVETLPDNLPAGRIVIGYPGRDDVVSENPVTGVAIDTDDLGDLFAESWDFNPWTRRTWSDTELDSLRAGVDLATSESGTTLRVSAIRVEIYTEEERDSGATSCRRCSLATSVACVQDDDCGTGEGTCVLLHAACTDGGQYCVGERMGERCQDDVTLLCADDTDCPGAENKCIATRCSANLNQACTFPTAGNVDSTTECTETSGGSYSLAGGESWCAVDAVYLGKRCSLNAHRACASDSDCNYCTYGSQHDSSCSVDSDCTGGGTCGQGTCVRSTVP
jgi:myo-inositol-hexaphosphate 3-phosphohydrolase